MTAERKQSLYCCELIPGQMKKDFYLGINIGLLKWNLLQKQRDLATVDKEPLDSVPTPVSPSMIYLIDLKGRQNGCKNI